MARDHRSQPPERKPGWPDGQDDVINKYGTYEVQRTCGMENEYPQIAQGLSPQAAEEQRRAAEAWKKSGRPGAAAAAPTYAAKSLRSGEETSLQTGAGCAIIGSTYPLRGADRPCMEGQEREGAER